jgi:hypothetical protein
VIKVAAGGAEINRLDPDKADVKCGAKADFAVTGFINGETIGGVNLIITKR